MTRYSGADEAEEAPTEAPEEDGETPPPDPTPRRRPSGRRPGRRPGGKGHSRTQQLPVDSVIETCRKRQTSPWTYIAEVLRQRRKGLTAPALPQPAAA